MQLADGQLEMLIPPDLFFFQVADVFIRLCQQHVQLLAKLGSIRFNRLRSSRFGKS